MPATEPATHPGRQVAAPHVSNLLAVGVRSAWPGLIRREEGRGNATPAISLANHGVNAWHRFRAAPHRRVRLAGGRSALRLHVGPPPQDPAFLPGEGGWQHLREPRNPYLQLLLSLPLGALAGVAYMAATAALSPACHVQARLGPAELAVLLLLLVPIHELLHAACYPVSLRSPRLVLGVWPRLLAAYACFEGELSRRRMAGVYLCPFMVLSALTLFGVSVDGAHAPSWLGLGAIHAAMCSVDFLGVLLILRVPRGALIRNHGWHTYWRPPRAQAVSPAAGSPRGITGGARR